MAKRDTGMVVRAYTFKIYPRPKHAAVLDGWARTCAWFWNRLLEHWIEREAAHVSAYQRAREKDLLELRIEADNERKEQNKKLKAAGLPVPARAKAAKANITVLRRPTKFEHSAAVREVREIDAGLRALPAGMLHDVVRRFHISLAKFWADYTKAKSLGEQPPKRRKVKNAQIWEQWFAGFPRFKDIYRADSVGMQWQRQCPGSRISIKDFSARVRWHRQLPDGAVVKHVVMRREGTKYFLILQCDVPAEAVARDDGTIDPVGVDVGLTHLLALSDGTTVPNPRMLRQLAADKRIWQRKMSRRTKRSRGWREAAQHVGAMDHKIKRSRKDLAHRLSRQLARDHGVVVVEDLTGNGLRRSKLAKHILDAQWGRIVAMTEEKCGQYKDGMVIKVDPRYTSQICPACGAKAPKDLSVRIHKCADCGLELDRDVAAAQVILQRGMEILARGGEEQ